jgi:hypothetical protein
LIRIWLGFIGWSVLVAAGVGLAGRAWLGEAAAGAVGMGVAASLLGAVCGSLPLAAELAAPSGKPVAAIGKATGFRLLATLAVALLAAVAGGWDRKLLLGSVAASYVALLAVETGWFLKQARKERSTR